MAIPEHLTPLKQRAFEKGWLLEQIPFGVRLSGYNGMLVACYGAGNWALTKFNVLALDSDAAEMAGQIRTALSLAKRRDERTRKASLARGERRSKARLKRA